MHRIAPISIVLLLCLLPLLGCGSRPKLAAVNGTVRYKGKPLPSGNVVFVPETGSSTTGEIRNDGNFELPGGAPVGRYEVAISIVADTTGRLPEDRTPLPPSVKLPLKYMTAKTSGLKAEVKEGPNTFNFDLK